MAYRTPNAVDPKIANCQYCDEPILVGSIDGLEFRLSRISISLNEARTLWKFGHEVFVIRPNEWRHRGWVATDWLPPDRPRQGRLYTKHVCGIWR